MANSNKPYGFKLVGSLKGAPLNFMTRKYYVPSTYGTAIFIGDIVLTDGTAGSLNPDDVLYPGAIVGATTSLVLGVCVGVQPSYPDLTINYRKASTGMYIYVHTDPQAVYSVQGDSTVFAVTDVGLNATITATAGDTATGRSKMVITAPSASAAKGTLIVGVDPALDNEMGAYCRFLVKLNLHQFGTAIVGA